MLQIHSGNRLEALLGVFSTRAVHPADPLEPQTLIVQNAGMARWIAQQTAIAAGISANVATHSPGTYLWNLPGWWDDHWQDSSDWSKEVLQWRIYAAIPALLERDSFAELAHYLKADDSGAGLFQLARKIAEVFDRYLVYRADLVAAWEAGQHHHWQAELWRAIRARHDSPHWGDVAQVVAGHAQRRTSPLRPLPERIALFGVSSLPAVHLNLLQSLAVFTDVDLYYLNPSRAYWADIVDQRGQARRRARALKAGLDDPTGLLDLGNPLLASWGLAGQAFLDQLLESGAQDEEYFIDPTGNQLLHRIQSDMLELVDRTTEPSDEPVVIAPDDRSIQIHSAHSALREVQILHDQLLNLFGQLDDLEPREIIVMAPNIEQYAPFIETTFAVVPSQQDIPWTIADRPMRREQQLLEVLVLLLSMPDSRFESTELLSLLDVPAVARRLGLDLDVLGQLRKRVSGSGIRWSLNAAMRESLDLPGDGTNSWDFGLQRLFAGYAMPADSDVLISGVAPYLDVEGADAEQLAVLQQLVDLCVKWNSRLRTSSKLAHWLDLFDQLVRDFFMLDDEEQYVVAQLRERLRASIEQAHDAGVDLAVSRQVLLELLGGILDDDSNSRNFLNGAVTFSNMVPMRSIPFRVVCLLGMNATAFPRDDRPLPFDLIAQNPRRGDRARHHDDRYLFLETLLSAREVFYLSYIGRDARDNSPRAPATVIEELQSYIADGYGDVKVAHTVEHPLQPFSKRYFSSDQAPLCNYKPHWFDAARVATSLDLPVFYNDPAMPVMEEPALVDLADFCRFFSKPSQTFLQHRFEVSLYRQQDAPEVCEPFVLDGLEQWSLKQSILGRLDAGAEGNAVLQRLRAEGRLPAGESGDKTFWQVQDSVSAYRERLNHHRGEKLEPLSVDITAGPVILTGVLDSVSARGQLFSRLGRIRAADLVECWIRHLVFNVLAPAGIEHRSVAVGEEESCFFSPVEQCHELLAELAQIYQRGLCEPPPLFPETSLAYVKAQGSNPEKEILKAWEGDNTRGEAHDAAVEILWRGRRPFTEAFYNTATSVYGEMMNSVAFVVAADESV